MKREKIKLFVTLILIFVLTCFALGQNAPPSEGKETPVALGEQAVAFDADGKIALGGRLRTTNLNGTPDAPIRDARFIIENRSSDLFLYASGVVTFYDSNGVRCGQGAWNLPALAPGEAAQTDAPGARITCNATMWRIIATSLITRNGDKAVKPPPTPTPSPTPTPTP